MFLENTVNQQEQFGWIEVICGSMFSGKTEELIRRLKRAQFAKQKVEIFKPAVDVRYDENDVVSHQGTSITSTPVESASSILLMVSCSVKRFCKRFNRSTSSLGDSSRIIFDKSCSWSPDLVTEKLMMQTFP